MHCGSTKFLSQRKDHNLAAPSNQPYSYSTSTMIIDHPHTWVIEGSTTATPPHRPKVNIYHDDHHHEDRDHWSSTYLGDWRINDAIAAPPHRPDNYLALRIVGVLGLHHTSNLFIIMVTIIHKAMKCVCADPKTIEQHRLWQIRQIRHIVPNCAMRSVHIN